MLWLWCGLAAAAVSQFLAQELPYAVGMTLKREKRKKEKKKGLESIKMEKLIEPYHGEPVKSVSEVVS